MAPRLWGRNLVRRQPAGDGLLERADHHGIDLGRAEAGERERETQLRGLRNGTHQAKRLPTGRFADQKRKFRATERVDDRQPFAGRAKRPIDTDPTGDLDRRFGSSGMAARRSTPARRTMLQIARLSRRSPAAPDNTCRARLLGGQCSMGFDAGHRVDDVLPADLRHFAKVFEVAPTSKFSPLRRFSNDC